MNERRERLKKPLTTILGEEHPYEDFSGDALDWLEYLVLPCRIPLDFSLQTVGSKMLIGPQDNQRPQWITVEVSFDADGNWDGAALHNESLGRATGFIAHPGQGIEPSLAALLVGMQMYGVENNRRPAWTGWNPITGEDFYSSNRNEMEENRVAVLSRLRHLKVSSQVRLRALEAVARGNTEEFETAYKSEVIMTALSSDWHPL